MGFCLYNNVAVGAACGARRGLERVAIVDYDVHHGNGTQWIFYEDPSVLFVSSHQFPFYPGTGAADGSRARRRRRLDRQSAARGRGDRRRLRSRLSRSRRAGAGRVSPELLLVSAGFDAHERDPLAGMRMTTDGFGGCSRALCGAADELCGGRIVLVTEGGYDTRRWPNAVNE